jgi:hypothetical protein
VRTISRAGEALVSTAHPSAISGGGEGDGVCAFADIVTISAAATVMSAVRLMLRYYPNPNVRSNGMTGPEESLDPADWPQLRALGHRMVDDMMDYLEQVRERPVWRPVPAETRAALDEPLPRGPADQAAVYQQFREHILPYPNGNIHPRFWGWVMGTGTPLAKLADMLASGMNAHHAGYDQSPVLEERQVIRWMAEQ